MKHLTFRNAPVLTHFISEGQRLLYNHGVAYSGPHSRPTVLSVTQLSKSYGQAVAVDDISFKVDHNEIVGLLGPNGGELGYAK